MKRLILISAVAVVAFAGTAAAKGEKPKEASAKDRQKIEKVGDEYEKAFNQKDANKAAMLFTVDATIVDPMGEFKGREEIQQSLEKDLQGDMKEARINITTESVTMLTPTLALVDGEHQVTGAQKPEMNMKAGHVAILTKQGNEWKLQALRAFPEAQPMQQGVGGAGTEGMEQPMPTEPMQPDPMDPQMQPQPLPEEPMNEPVPQEPAPFEKR